MNGIGGWLAALAVVAGAAFGGTPVAAQATRAPEFLPHRAVYDMSLAPSRSGRNRLEQARGRLVYEFAGSSCEGWTTNLRMITELRAQEGQPQVSDIRSTSVEAGDGSEFRFVTRSTVNGRDRDSADGTARRAPDGGITVTLRRPGVRNLDLPAGGGLLFPVAHMRRVIEEARAGRTIFQSDIYDGSEGGEKVYATTAVIGRPLTTPIPQGHPADVERLRTAARLPVALSYFEKVQQGEALPLYEMSIELMDVGITRTMLLDYGEFAIRGEMTSLELLPEQACPR